MVQELGGFDAVSDAEELVGGAQVLLDGGLGQKKPPRYLGVGEALADELQDLPLAPREDVGARQVLRYQELEQLPRGNDLALLGHLEGADYLLGLHRRVDETAGPGVEGGPRQRQVEVQTEDEYRGVRVRLAEPLYALREAFHALRSEYYARRALPGRELAPNMYPRLLLEDLREADRDYWVGAVDPMKAQTLWSSLGNSRYRAFHLFLAQASLIK